MRSYGVMDSAQNGTIPPASECSMINMKYIAKTIPDITNLNSSAIVVRIGITDLLKRNT